MPAPKVAGPFSMPRGRRAARLLCLAGLVALRAIPALAQSSDVTPPSLVSFSFSPSAIDVTGGPQPVTVTARLTDDLSGVSSLGATFVSPNGQQRVYVYAYTSDYQPGLSVNVQGSNNFGQFSESGTWKVENVYTTDQVGNTLQLSTTELQSRGFPTTLVVTSVPDVTGPDLTGFGISPTAVNVSTSDQSVTVSLHATDDLSGVSIAPCTENGYYNTFIVTLNSPSGNQQRYVATAAFTLDSGTPLDGMYSATLTMPKNSEAGTWHVSYVYLNDCAGNYSFFSEYQLIAMGAQTTLDVVSNPQDTKAPTLTSLTYSPITINTATGSQTVTVRLGVTDDLSGATFAPTQPNISYYEAGITFRSPSGNQQREDAYFSDFHLISGTPLNGVWEGTVTFPQYSEQGSWRVTMVELADVVRNHRTYTTVDIQNLGFNTVLDVIKPSLIGDGSVGSSGGTVNDATFGSRASITFPAGVLTQPTQVAIDVFLDPLDVPTPVGFSGPGTNFVNIQLTPQPNFPLPVPGLTIVLPIPHPLTPGLTLFLYKIDVTTGALIAAHSVYGGDVTGIVNSDGLSATFTGISSLSTVVGLIPHKLNESLLIKPGTTTTTTVGATVTVNTSATDADGANGPWKYLLEWGDGTSFSANLTSLPTAAKPTPRGHVYTAKGTYTIKLTITGKNGNTDVQTLLITVN